VQKQTDFVLHLLLHDWSKKEFAQKQTDLVVDLYKQNKEFAQKQTDTTMVRMRVDRDIEILGRCNNKA
jgi:hypothetical protein